MLVHLFERIVVIDGFADGEELCCHDFAKFSLHVFHKTHITVSNYTFEFTVFINDWDTSNIVFISDATSVGYALV